MQNHTVDLVGINTVNKKLDIGNAVLFLASPASDYIVGTVMMVGGGVMIE